MNGDEVRLNNEHVKMNDNDNGQQWNCCQMNQMNPKSQSLNQQKNDVSSAVFTVRHKEYIYVL